MKRFFFKSWKYVFLSWLIIPLIASFLPIPSEVTLNYLFLPLGVSFLFLTAVCFLLILAAPPVVSVKVEKDD